MQAFGDAYRLVAPAAEAFKSASPYVITNCTGMSIDLELDNVFEVCVSFDFNAINVNSSHNHHLFNEALKELEQSPPQSNEWAIKIKFLAIFRKLLRVELV